MDTKNEDQNDVLVSLRGAALEMVKWIVANPRGFVLAHAAEQLGLSQMKALKILRWLTYSTGTVSYKMRKGFIKARFTPASLVVSDGAPLLSVGVTKATSSASLQTTSSGQTQATEIAWPIMPDVQSTGLQYSWFVKPDFYARIKSKVFVHAKHVR